MAAVSNAAACRSGSKQPKAVRLANLRVTNKRQAAARGEGSPDPRRDGAVLPRLLGQLLLDDEALLGRLQTRKQQAGDKASGKTGRAAATVLAASSSGSAQQWAVLQTANACCCVSIDTASCCQRRSKWLLQPLSLLPWRPAWDGSPETP